jgi:hypothetical protein
LQLLVKNRVPDGASFAVAGHIRLPTFASESSRLS